MGSGGLSFPLLYDYLWRHFGCEDSGLLSNCFHSLPQHIAWVMLSTNTETNNKTEVFDLCPTFLFHSFPKLRIYTLNEGSTISLKDLPGSSFLTCCTELLPHNAWRIIQFHFVPSESRNSYLCAVSYSPPQYMQTYRAKHFSLAALFPVWAHKESRRI